MKIETAILASGCFWGTEYFMKKHSAVISTEVGYCGGKTENPTYEDVCTGNTGHAEVVKVDFDADKKNFEDVLKLFFETHDFTQIGGVGPDIGDQYRSEIFYISNEHKIIAEKLINNLTEKGFKVATKLTPYSKFWKAEKKHQDYYYNTGGSPYCHIYKKIFD